MKSKLSKKRSGRIKNETTLIFITKFSFSAFAGFAALRDIFFSSFSPPPFRPFPLQRTSSASRRAMTGSSRAGRASSIILRSWIRRAIA